MISMVKPKPGRELVCWLGTGIRVDLFFDQEMVLCLINGSEQVPSLALALVEQF
jgi:hypothetical protein